MRTTAATLTTLCAACLILSGCNGSKDPPADSGAGKTAGVGGAVPGTKGPNPTGATESSDTGASASHGKWEVRTDSDGRKWFGDVPYDVFFDDPLGVANDNEPIVGMAAPPDKAEAQQPTTPESPEKPATAASTASSWQSVITAEALDSEVKKIRNFLNPKLQSVGQYNSNLSMIPPQAATLAALAAIAARHEGDISWKSDALYIRDLAGAMNKEPLQRGPKFQRALLTLYAQISDTLNRSRPGDLPEPNADAPIADHAEMGFLMKRMEQAHDEMKTKAGSEDSFRKSLDMIRQESAILSALAKVITTEGYGYEEDEEFIAFARTVSASGRKMIEAVAIESFAEYDTALSAAYQACNQCHLGYK